MGAFSKSSLEGAEETSFLLFDVNSPLWKPSLPRFLDTDRANDALSGRCFDRFRKVSVVGFKALGCDVLEVRPWEDIFMCRDG
jgi:hypothetical protein